MMINFFWFEQKSLRESERLKIALHHIFTDKKLRKLEDLVERLAADETRKERVCVCVFVCVYVCV